jgi:hypothetical protein
MSRTKIETARDFKAIVDEDYAAYKAEPLNLRLAFNLALGLFHLRDWTLLQYSGEPNWRPGDYQLALELRCPQFGYMRDLANAVKHGVLDPKKKPSTQMVGLANTSISHGAFQSNAFQNDAFQTRTYIVSQTAPKEFVDFENAADAVTKMWNDLFTSNNW